VSDLITVVIQAIIPNDIILISVSNLLNVWIGNSVYSLIQGTIPDSFFSRMPKSGFDLLFETGVRTKFNHT